MKKIEERNTHPQPLYRFEVSKGSTTIKVALYPSYFKGGIAGHMAELERARIDAQHRADQLEPPDRTPRAPRREPGNYSGHQGYTDVTPEMVVGRGRR